MAEYHFDLFADYYQFYLQDEQAQGDLSESWTPETTNRMLALAPGTIGVGTVRNMTIPVTVEIADGVPAEDFAEGSGQRMQYKCSIRPHRHCRTYRLFQRRRTY